MHRHRALARRGRGGGMRAAGARSSRARPRCRQPSSPLMGRHKARCVCWMSPFHRRAAGGGRVCGDVPGRVPRRRQPGPQLRGGGQLRAGRLAALRRGGLRALPRAPQALAALLRVAGAQGAPPGRLSSQTSQSLLAAVRVLQMHGCLRSEGQSPQPDLACAPLFQGAKTAGAAFARLLWLEQGPWRAPACAPARWPMRRRARSRRTGPRRSCGGSRPRSASGAAACGPRVRGLTSSLAPALQRPLVPGSPAVSHHSCRRAHGSLTCKRLGPVVPA